MVDILTMNRRIDRKTDTERARPSRDVALFLQASLIAGESIGVFRIDVLKRNLHVIQPDRREPAQTVFAEQDAGGNEIGIETGLDAVGEDPIEIAAHGWFAASTGAIARRPSPPPWRKASPHSSAVSSAWARSSRAGWSNRDIATGSDG